MWAMFDTGFLSIVQHDKDPDTLLVRARAKGDIESVLGDDIEVREQPGADYLFRAEVPRAKVAEIVAKKVMDLDYTSHAKDVAIQRSPAAEGRSTAYYAVWSALAKIQPYAPYSKFPRGQEPTPSVYPAARTAGTYRWGDDAWGDRVPVGDGFYLEDDGRGGVRTVPVEQAAEEQYITWDACSADMGGRKPAAKCGDCGHAAVLHPGHNDVDECLACDLEQTMDDLYGKSA